MLDAFPELSAVYNNMMKICRHVLLTLASWPNLELLVRVPLRERVKSVHCQQLALRRCVTAQTSVDFIIRGTASNTFSDLTNYSDTDVIIALAQFSRTVSYWCEHLIQGVDQFLGEKIAK